MNMRSYTSYKRCTCATGIKRQTIKPDINISRLLKIAATPSKLTMLLLLAKAPHCVCDLMTHTKLSQTLISHHLSNLAGAGLVQSEKNGAFVDYSLTAKGRKLIRVIKKLTS